MKHLKRLLIFVFLAAAALSASPLCTDGSLDGYITNRVGLANACEVNGVLFYNFTYTGSMATDFVDAPSVQVLVNPGGLPGAIDLRALWVIQSMDTDPTGINGPVYEDLHVTFDVMSTGALPIITIHNAYNSSTLFGGTLSGSATCDSPCSVPGGNFANDTKNLTSSTVGPFTVHNDFYFTADGTDDTVHLSIITNQITVAQSLISQGVPEPVTCVITGGALVLLGLLKRRRLS